MAESVETLQKEPHSGALILEANKFSGSGFGAKYEVKEGCIFSLADGFYLNQPLV